MIFEILDKNGNFIDYDILDEEVSQLLDISTNTETYITPKDYHHTWLDLISIEASNASSWRDIINQLCHNATIGESTYEGIIENIQFYKPLIEICLYFQNKGYIPYVYKE